MSDEAAAAYYSSLSVAERNRLRQLDRAALSLALKAAALKMGVRLKVELLLKQPEQATTVDISEPTEAPASSAPVEPPVLPDKLSGTFVAAAAFAGFKAGYVFKAGKKGVGYYSDELEAFMDPDEAKLKRGFTGNLSWLSEEPEEAAAPSEEEPPAPPPSSSSSSKATSTALIIPGTPKEPIQCENGKLSERRKAVLEKQAGPFAPDLKEGKYSDVGQVLRVNGKWWGLCVKCELHSYYCRNLKTEQISAHGFQELETTEMSLTKFLAAEKRWDARRPLAARTLRDDRKGQVHKSWTGPDINQMRLMDKSAVGKGYYYGVVPSTPVLMPPRIDQKEVDEQREKAKAAANAKATSEGKEEEEGGDEEDGGAPKAKSNYYYAHRRKIDWHIPTPVPARID